MGGLAPEILKLLETPHASQGDYFEIIQKIEAYFELYDVLYGVTSNAFNIKASLLAMPNPKYKELQGGFRAKLTEAALKNLRETYGELKYGDTSELSLKYIFDALLAVLNYKFIRPASFPYINRFYIGKENKGPARAIIAPDLDTSPPPLCNVFFPDQVQTFQFARDLKNETTRLIAQAPIGHLDSAVFKMFYPIYVTPSVAIEGTEDGGYQTGFSVEESYRGVVPRYVELDRTFYAALQADLKKSRDGETNDILTPDIFSDSGVVEGEGIHKEE